MLSAGTGSCGCLRGQRVKTALSPEVALLKDRWKASQVWRFYQYQRGALARNYSFELSPAEFENICQQACFYCGAPPTNVAKLPRPVKTKGRQGDWLYNGIDRRDNTQGYTLANSVACCKQCNYAKHAYTEQEFLDWVNRVALHQVKKRRLTLVA